MTYFKNVELAQRYHVSESTVRNWVKMTKQGRLDLTLSRVNGRDYVANLPSNMKIVEKLIQANRKYRNALSARTITPRPQFYQFFTQAQIYDIVRSLEIHHEIPRQYNYFDGGAEEWDVYAQKLVKEDRPSLLTRSIELIDDSLGYFDRRLAKYRRVNVVDIGVGNALPTKDLLEHLLQRGVLGRYIAIDISPEMLEIARRNVKQWFEGKVLFEGHQMDMTYERFAAILAEDYLRKDAYATANLVLCLGGTPDCFRNPDDVFRTINESMNPNDLFVYTDKLETDEMRPEWFEHSAKPGKLTVEPRHRVVFDLLNIDESLYEVEMGFDKSARQRYLRTRLRVDLTLRFEFEDGERLIEFAKGESILLWRSWQVAASDVLQQLDRNGFYMLHSSQTEDRQYILTVAEVKR